MSLLGFNEAYYLAAKLHALQADSKTSSEWGVKNIDDLKVALAENGFTAETHYMTWGWQEHLVPNEYFNADEYSLNKATQLYHDSPDIYPSIAAAEAAFKAAWPGDVYQHYIEYGISEGISPSNSNVSNSNAEPLVITATGVQGFDETYYLGVKLKSLQAQFSEWVVKDTADLKTALADAGFTPETHYMTWGWQEHLAPNEYFNAAEYARAVATNRYNESLFNHTNTYASIDAAEAAFKAEYTGDMYQHYLQDGSAKDINPSNSFDASFYYASKLVQLQADNATKAEWSTKTVDDVKAAILGNGMTALSHYEMYGKTEGVAV
ncbi:MAG: hypothetical protein JZU70_00375, partial [Chlorobium sp.]|nr:hypothetical protein [Chlorobium sp.]